MSQISRRAFLRQVALFGGAAVVVAHHFAKGDSTAKAAIDRASGAGVWSRGTRGVYNPIACQRT